MSRFLIHPELFPARLAGEPWGSEEVVVDLPGGPFAIRGMTADQKASLLDRFSVAAAADGYQLSIFRASPSDFVAIDTRGWSYDLDVDGPCITGMNLMARVGDDRGAIWTPSASRDDFPGVMENVLRPLVARRLLASGGLLVHSASVVFDGRGIILAGPSGAGKSTLAALAVKAGHAVLSDDLNAIIDGALVPLPFTGDLEPGARRQAPGAPIHVIASLEKGATDATRPLSRAGVVSLLVSCAPYVNRDSALADTLMNRAEELARRVRGAVLTFRRDGDVWPILASL